MIFAVDFDGTCVSNEFPKVGKNIGAGPVLRLLKSKGHSLILNTLRGNTNYSFSGVRHDETFIAEALQWAKANGVNFDKVNENLLTQDWTDSKKIYADFYIDDRNLGSPQTTEGVDWRAIATVLMLNKYITEGEYVRVKQEINEDYGKTV